MALETHDLNFNVESVKGSKKHYGFHIQAESKEEALKILGADLKEVVAQCGAPVSAGSTGKKKGGKKVAAPAPAAPAAKKGKGGKK